MPTALVRDGAVKGFHMVNVGLITTTWRPSTIFAQSGRTVNVYMPRYGI